MCLRIQQIHLLASVIENKLYYVLLRIHIIENIAIAKPIEIVNVERLNNKRIIIK